MTALSIRINVSQGRVGPINSINPKIYLMKIPISIQLKFNQNHTAQLETVPVAARRGKGKRILKHPQVAKMKNFFTSVPCCCCSLI